MEHVEYRYRKIKHDLLVEEGKLLQVLSGKDFLRGIASAREAVWHRIKDDDNTLSDRDMKLSFSSNRLDMSTFNMIVEQDKRCAPLRDEWRTLVKLKNES